LADVGTRSIIAATYQLYMIQQIKEIIGVSTEYVVQPRHFV